MAEVAVFGYGTVGSGVVEVIDNNAELMKQRGADLHVKYVLDIRDFSGDPISSRLVKDVDVIINDPEISVVCETMGGATFAYEYSKKALEKGISVCTSNKELVEAKGAELMEIAKAHGCNYLFEASVGGGIPLIRTINEALTAERIDRIYGILNGTTNYILTKMDENGADFADVLKEAQELGYAEKDPTADVEGHDACRKIAILASLVSGKKVNWTDIETEGITKIDTEDFKYAKELGCSIKLIAMCDFNGGCSAMVSPRLITGDSPLNSVKGVFNGVLVHSDMLDDSMYYGRGAGKLATASAVVADAFECVHFAGKEVGRGWSSETLKLRDPGEMKGRFFVRVENTGAEEAAKVLGATEILKHEKETGLVSAEMTGNDFKDKLSGLSGVIKFIRF